MESNPRPQHYQVCTGNAADLPEHTKPQVRLSWAAGVAGLAKSTTFRDRGRSVRRRAHDVAVWLRRRNDTAKDEVLAITGQLTTLAEATIGEARQVALNARRTLHRRKVAGSGQTRRALAEIDRVAGLLEQVVAQTRTRLGGEVPDGSTRVVSLHDPDARPIRKGRLGRPVEFGYKAQIADNADGLVIDHTVAVGNPPDAPMLAPAISRIKARFGRAPKSVTADRGYGETSVDDAVGDLGVKTVAIPRRGKTSPTRTKAQRDRGFVRLVKWRTGSEARISCLKRDYLWRRTLFDSLEGTQTWCGWGVLAHNSIKVAALTADRHGEPGRRATVRRQGGTDPPTTSTEPAAVA